jgi:formylmethanofuran dehydrogenase subunit E
MTNWEKCVAFHGHECGGLTIGYKAALYAIDLLNLEFSDDEQVVCICENDACGVDAIQVLLGCSVGKGNLLFHMRGKQAFSFYNRKTGKSVRLVLKAKPFNMSREDSFTYYQSCDPADMFEVKDTTIHLPEKARIFHSYTCDWCGESTGANWIRLSGEKSCAWTATKNIIDLMYNKTTVSPVWWSTAVFRGKRKHRTCRAACTALS